MSVTNMNETDFDLLDAKQGLIKNSRYRLLKESNEFYRVRHNMTVHQQRLLLLTISELQFKNQINLDNTTEVPTVTLYIPEIEKALGVSKSNKIYKDLYGATRSFGTCAFERRIAPKEYEIVSLIEKARVSKGRGLVQIQLTKTALNFFGDLTENYHKFQLRMITMLSSTYQMNLYRALCNVENTSHKSRKFWLYPEYSKGPNDLYLPDVLGYRPDMTKSYQEYKNVKRRILSSAIKGVEEKTDIVDISLEEILLGRKVIGVKISFRIDYSRRSSLRAASQSWMHPLEHYFSTEHYKKLSPSDQKSYDENGFKREDIKKCFHIFLIENESLVRKLVIERGEVYPDISTIQWYVDWLQKHGYLSYKNEAPSMMNPEQSYTSVLHTARYQTEKEELLPKDFDIDDQLAEWAISFYPHAAGPDQTTAFMLYHRENQTKSKNWALRWMRWLAGARNA